MEKKQERERRESSEAFARFSSFSSKKKQKVCPNQKASLTTKTKTEYKKLEDQGTKSSMRHKEDPHERTW